MISRIEALVLNILGEKEELFNPQSRIEEILYSILQDTAYIKNPLSRIEAILLAIKNSDEYTRNALSRVEEILLAVLDGTNDYDKIPQSDIERDLIRFLGEWVTKSGSIVSYDTDQVTPPLKKLEVKMEPIQDLNGYSSPWPAGGGKNHFNYENAQATTGAYGLVPTIDNTGLVTISGTYPRDITTAMWALATNVPYIEGQQFLIYDKNSEAETNITRVRWTNTTSGGVAVDMKNLELNKSYNIQFRVMICDENITAPTSWQPYSNICPISGHEGAKVMRTGMNLLRSYSAGNTNTQAGMTGTANADGSITFNGTTTGTFWGLGDSPSFYLKAGTYTLSQSEIAGIITNLVKIQSGGNVVLASVGTTLSNTFSLDNDAEVYFYNRINSGVTLNNKKMYFQLERSSTAHAYEPYTAVTHEIPFSTEVYGGKLNVETGELVVDRAMYIPTGNEVSYVQQTQRIAFALPTGYRVPGSVYRVCSTFQVQTSSTYCYVYTDLSIDELKSYFQQNDVQIVVGLATPITIQLTPTEVRSLLGRNNIWSDAGDVTVCYHS